MATETRTRRVLNTDACPTTNPAPDPQFSGAAICVYEEPRPNSLTQRRKKDVNPSSPTFGQWLKGDGTYTVSETEGDYFMTGEGNFDLCPTPTAIPLYIVILPGVINVYINGEYIATSQPYYGVYLGDTISYSCMADGYTYLSFTAKLYRDGILVDTDTFYPPSPGTGSFTLTIPADYEIRFQDSH